MFRLFLALNLLLLNIYACKGGYDSCKLKINDSNSIQKNIINLPIKKNQRLVFSTTTPEGKILKHDPYLSLYLIEDKKGFSYPFRINNRLTLGTATVNKSRAVEGKIKKRQIGLNRLATFSETVDVPSVLLTSCCSLEGISTSKGIIEKEYLQRFINIKKVSYADIGIRVDDGKSCVFVESINPYMKDNLFMIGDCVLSFDANKVKDASTLMRWILFSKIGSTHTLKIKRDLKYLTLKVKIQNRHGGGYLRDIYLEFLGLYFNKNLEIVKIAPKAKKYGLKLGDKLLKINQNSIPAKDEIDKIVSQTKKSVNLLFQRDHFQFFVKVKSI